MSVWLERTAQRALAMAVAVVLLSSCGREPALSVVFTSSPGVEKGSEVIYDGAVVGRVEKISSEAGGTRVHLAIEEGNIERLHTGSAAMPTTHGGAPALELFDRDGGEALADGGELVALNNTFEYLAWQAGKAAESAQSSLNDMTESLRAYFDGEEWARKRDEVESSLAELGVNAEQKMQKMEEDYDAMIEDLEAKTEESAELARKHYEQLKANLEEQLTLLMENGEEVVAGTLRQFSEAVDTLMEKYAAENPR